MLHNSLFESFLLSDMQYNLVQSEIYESLQNSLPHIERARKDLLPEFMWKLYWRDKKLHRSFEFFLEVLG